MELDFSQGSTRYLIDTSGLIFLDFIFKHDNPVFKAIWEEIEELMAAGWHIGSHTHTHPNLSDIASRAIGLILREPVFIE